MAKSDVEMKEESQKNDTESEEPKAEVSKEEKERLVLEDLKEQVKYIEKSVSSKEPRFLTRVLRSIPATRKKLTHPILRKLICGFFPNLISDWLAVCLLLGIIKAIQLDYSEAHKNLLQAIRKAPQQAAYGFKQTAQKFAIVVQLLLGEIPDRATFREPFLRKTLVPYFQLTQAVLNGDLKLFNQMVDKFKEKFLSEKTYTLIIRLRHNVIKAGVRMINLSYSRISLSDIALKLQLDSPEDAEFIVAKVGRHATL
ncbi:PREDICTED: 26S proteasome non-ATPase regulatory subunit 3-like [Acropora digitifera]|uniref:26S proteasome non-ATPase regulatory subunit 3-like n=1 Tax=Acropora digitifera TaxID=70779 RepID=UPI00077A2785|nr:PREDICTED: 26S proteasome non-ATPase regulatory subunit 3-like [Acropora digitifera]